MPALTTARVLFMFSERILRKKIKNRTCYGAITEEVIVTLWVLFLFLFFPMVDLATIGLRAFFFWFSCEQAAMAGAKGSVWSTNAYISANHLYSSTYYTSIQTQAINTANTWVQMFSGIQMTGSPILTVYPQPITNSGAGSLTNYTPTIGSVLDKSQYIPILQVTMAGYIEPFITIPFIPAQIPGLNAKFPLIVKASQVIENIDALAY
jgi:hypothetical protein